MNIFTTHGHDVKTVVDQDMQSYSDHNLISKCKAEKRCIVTLDLDFSNSFVFPPEEYYGIAVLRLSSPSILYDLDMLVGILAEMLSRKDITGKLWIVQKSGKKSGIREYLPE